MLVLFALLQNPVQPTNINTCETYAKYSLTELFASKTFWSVPFYNNRTLKLLLNMFIRKVCDSTLVSWWFYVTDVMIYGTSSICRRAKGLMVVVYLIDQKRSEALVFFTLLQNPGQPPYTQAHLKLMHTVFLINLLLRKRLSGHHPYNKLIDALSDWRLCGSLTILLLLYDTALSTMLS